MLEFYKKFIVTNLKLFFLSPYLKIFLSSQFTFFSESIGHIRFLDIYFCPIFKTLLTFWKNNWRKKNIYTWKQNFKLYGQNILWNLYVTSYCHCYCFLFSRELKNINFNLYFNIRYNFYIVFNFLWIFWVIFFKTKS